MYIDSATRILIANWLSENAPKESMILIFTRTTPTWLLTLNKPRVEFWGGVNSNIQLQIYCELILNQN